MQQGEGRPGTSLEIGVVQQTELCFQLGVHLGWW